MQPKIIILSTKKPSAAMVYNALSKQFKIDKIIFEGAGSRYKFIKRRIKKLGLKKVIGQILFKIIIIPFLKKTSKKRIAQIINEYQLQEIMPHEDNIIQVKNINSQEAIEKIKFLQPDIVIVHSTRIISEEVLHAINVPFINIHAGITPLYRGVHGAYWALANNNKENCGVTVHFVDKGIDTGKILAQEKINVSGRDNFITYPFIQLGVGLILLKQVINTMLRQEVEVLPNPEGMSVLRSHPTFFEYIYNWLAKKVK